MIKFLDLQKQYHTIKKEMDAAIFNVIENSAFIGGKWHKEFESSFSKFQDAPFCIGVGNGTDAIEIVIEALGIPKGSEIIVPANSFIASSEAVTNAGCRVVFCDARADDYTINIDSLKSKISSKTKAVLAVHLYGQPCRLDELLEICQERKLFLLEDSAQAHGAEYRGKRVGTIGSAGTFSFYPGKNLGAYGDAGAIVCRDSELAEKCRMIANHGRVKKYDHEFEGRNSRLDGLQAAVLTVKLKYLEEWIDKRNTIADWYFDRLKGVNGLVLPLEREEVRHGYHLFVVRTERRDELKSFLAEKEIQTGIHYPIALPKLNAYAYAGQANENFFANHADTQLLSLPMGEHLNESEVDIVCGAVKEFFGS